MKRATTIAAIAIAILFESSLAGSEPIRSQDADRSAYLIPRGSPRTLMTEVWVARGDGSGARRLGIFPGLPGLLGFLPGDEGLLYREKGLSYPLFGSHLIGGRDRPLVGGRAWRIAFDGAVCPEPSMGDGPAPPDVTDARAPTRPPNGSPEGGGGGADSAMDPHSESVCQELGRALGLFLMGYHARHRGDFVSENSHYEEAIQVFEAIPKRSAPGGIPAASVAAYLQVLRDRILRSDQARRQEVCEEHLLVLGDMLSGFSSAHDQRLPISLKELQAWVSEANEARTADPMLRSRDVETLAQLMRCPSYHGPRRPIPYLYDGRPGTRGYVLSCFGHRGGRLDLVGRPGKFRVASGDLSEGQVDSLRDVANRHLRDGAADSAVYLMSVVAHQRPRSAEAHLGLGEAALKAEDFGRAEEAFRMAASIGRGPAMARAYLGLGKIAMARPKGYLTAIDYFREALIQDRKFVDARFQMARARLLLLEYDARADIETVLRMDPNYAEAYLLMGSWYADLKEEYGQAIPWYAKYLVMRPDSPEGRRRMSIAYLKVKDYAKVLETLSGFVLAHPDAIEAVPIVAQACVKQEKLDMALSFYRTYLTRCDPKERALYEDIGLIASREEMEGYARTSGTEREAFLKRFWNSRDPDLSTPVNERLLEHYRRVWYSRQTFSDGRQPWDRRGEVYVRFGEPDHRTSSAMLSAPQSLAVQRIKERMALDIYGTSAIGETYMGPVFPVRSLTEKGRRPGIADELPEYAIETQSDLSQPTGGSTTRVEEATNKESGNTETKEQTEQRRPGTRALTTTTPARSKPFRMRPDQEEEDPFELTGFRPVSVSGADISTVPWESWVYTGIGEGFEITFTDEGANGIYDYAPVPMDQGMASDQMARFSRYSPKRVAERAMVVSPDYYPPKFDSAPFPFYFDVADFRGPDGRSVLEVYYGIPRAGARYLPAEGVTRLVVERQAALVATDADTVFRSSGELFFQADGNQGGEGAFVPDVARLEVPAATYRLEVKARDRLTGRLGLYRKELRVEAYGRERLQLSDLELAWRISEGGAADKFSKGNLQVIPMPMRTYRKAQNVFVYYEVYNLKRDPEGQTKYQVEYTIGQREGGILSHLIRTFVGKRGEVAVGYEGRGSREMEAAYKEMDLRDFSPGRYYLRTVVTDLSSGETAAKEVSFGVVE